MSTETSLHALQDASPRNQPRFGEWLERLDALRTQITATPVPGPGDACRISTPATASSGSPPQRLLRWRLPPSSWA